MCLGREWGLLTTPAQLPGQGEDLSRVAPALSPQQGKSKGKGKSGFKSKGKKRDNFISASSSTPASSTALAAEGPGNAACAGHDFRSFSSLAYMVHDGPVKDPPRQRAAVPLRACWPWQFYPGFAVVDSGAAEKPGCAWCPCGADSMDSRTCVPLGAAQLLFREGTEAEGNFFCGGRRPSMAALGVYALDVPRVPILLSIRTLKRMGSVIDFKKKTMIFKAIDPG